jgi:large subunit ribosomal protein L10
MAQDYVTEPAKAKIEAVAELKELVGKSTAAILADYRGLSVAELTELRKKLRAADTEFRVVKNTLFKLAAEGKLPVAEMEAFLKGPTAIGFAQGDPVGAAKVMVDFAKDHKTVSLKAGVLGTELFSVAQVEALAKTPPRDVLLAQLMGSLNAPISGLVGTLSGIISKFVFTLQAIADQKGEVPAEA